MSEPLRVDLSFLLGDTWAAAEAWAVVINDAAVDLAVGWTVRAQARPSSPDSTVLFEWSTTNSRVLLGTAAVTLSTGVTVTTSTVRLRHSAIATAAVQPFVGELDCQIERGDPADPERYTIAAGSVRARRDVTR